MFELTKNNPFWKFSLLWKTFLTSGVATITIAILEALIHGKFSSWTASSLKFGKVRVEDVTPSDVMVGAIVLGIISGLLGPFFINVNTRVNAIRAKIWTKKWHKAIDTWLFCMMSATCFYWFPYWFRSCVPRTILDDNLVKELSLSLETVHDSEEE